MKKLFLLVTLVAMLALPLSGCAAARHRDNLPQGTRPDRFVCATCGGGGAAVAAAPAPVAAAAPAAAETAPAPAPAENALETTFFTREDGVITFFVGHQAEAAHPLHMGVMRFADEVAMRSDGQLQVEVLYGGMVGGDMNVRNLVLANELDVGAITTWGIWQDLTPAANLESLPFLFDSYEEAWAAYEGTLGEWVAQNIIEPNGAMSLGFWTNGLRHFTNNVRPFFTPEDLRGVRMRSMQMSVHLDMYETFGSASLSMPFGEVFGALADGVADGQDNPFGNIHAARLFEVQRYLSLSAHMYTCAPIIASNDFWNSLSEEHQEIILESARVAGRFQGELTQAMEDMQLAEIIAFGTQVNEVYVPAFREAVEPIWYDHVYRFGNEFVTIAARYINDVDSLAHRFAY